MNTTDNIGVNRNYKDRLFRLLFSQKKYALELYNALNHSDYTNENELEIRTLEDVIWMNKNMELEAAVSRAIDECIREGVLSEFLMLRRGEVMNSILTEFDEEQVLADIRQEEYEEGRTAGRTEGIEAFILDHIEDGKSEEQILEKLIRRFSLEYEEAEKYYYTCLKGLDK